MGVYSTTQANAYADKIKAVYEHLDEIKKVADRLTPVEDLSGFQAQIEALYAQLDLLVEASTVIAGATPIGESILTGTKASIQALLDIGVFPDGLVWQDELDAQLAALQAALDATIAPLLTDIAQHDVALDQLTQFYQTQQTDISGLQTNYSNLATGQAANQSNIEQAFSRLTINEEAIVTIDERLDSLDQSVANALTGVQATNSVVAGHTASIASLDNTTALHTASIDSLSSDLANTNTNVTANTAAISEMETTIIGIGDDIVAQSQQTTALKSVIGGSGNLLPNADFASGALGWSIIVAEEDWASTVLTLDTFNMPVDVHCLEVLGTPSPNGQIVVQSPVVLVEGGQWYGVSGYPCVDNGTVTLSYKAFNAAGAVVDQNTCPGTFNVTTNLNFSAYTRTWKKFLLPSTAVTLRLYLTVTGDGDFITQGALFRPMVEKVWAEQEAPSAWTPNVSGVPEALATAVQTLNTNVSTINGQITAMSSAATALTSRVDTAEAALINEMITSANKDSSFTASINNLSGRLTTAEGTITSQGSAISTLQTQQTSLNGTVTSHTSQLTSLQAQVNSMDTSTGGFGSAISALDTRVTAAEGTIASHSSAITALQASVTSANKIIAQNAPPSTSGRTEGDVWIDTDDGNKFYVLTSGVWVARPDLNKNSIFVQPTQPTAYTLNDLWIETDNNNKVWRWNGATWVDASDARITSQGTAITNLETRATAIEGVNTSQGAAITTLQNTVNDAGTGVAATASAVSALTTRVTNAENVNTSQATSITTLTSGVAGAQAAADNAAAAAATAQSAANTANSALADIASDSLLTPGEKPVVIRERDQLIAEQTGIDAQATSYGITTEKTAYDNAVSALTTYLATLTTPVLWSNLTGNTTIVGTTFRTKFADVYATRQTLLNKILGVAKTASDANASATSALTTRVTAAEGNITSQASQITSLNSTVAGKASASAVVSLETRATALEQSAPGSGNLLTNAAMSNGLEGWGALWNEGGFTGDLGVRDLAGDSWRPTGVHVLGSRLNGNPGSQLMLYGNLTFIPIQGLKRYMASAYVAAHRCEAGVGIAFFDAAYGQLSQFNVVNPVLTGGTDLNSWSRVPAAATAPSNARYARIYLWQRATGGGDSPYAWWARPMLEEVPDTATQPSPWSPGGAEAFAKWGVVLDVNGYVSGVESSNNGTSSNFTIRADKFQVIDPSNASNLLSYSGGNLNVSGMISGSLLKSSAMELASTRIYTGGGRMAPFVVRDMVSINTGLTYNSKTLQLDNFISPDWGSGYDWKRLAAKRMDVFIEVLGGLDAASDGTTETCVVEVSYDGGGWSQIHSVTSAAAFKAALVMSVRYTTLDNWSYCSFRARTTQGRTLSMTLKVEVLNFNVSGNAPGSSSGMSGATGSAPPSSGSGGSGGGGDFCVDWETTVLPDGRYVRDLRPGDMVECVDVRTGELSWQPLRAMALGSEDCYRVFTPHGEVIQSGSTPMDLRTGGYVYTTDLAGHEVLTHDHGWEVASTEYLGPRLVCKPDFGDRMFFAGTHKSRALATHNVTLKP